MLPVILCIFAMMLVAFALGLHVATALGLTALGAGWLFSERPVWDILSYIPWNTITNLSLVALPLFVLMGEILLRSGATDRMYQTLGKWLNNMPGGLLHTNIVASALFACISGSSAATAATIGSVALPYMSKRGYDRRLTMGTLAAGGTLGILIPPSIVMIVYAVLASESIGKLYMAGIVPGLLLMVFFLIIIFTIAIFRPSVAPKEAASTWREKIDSVIGLAPVLILITIVLGSIYLGIATATEAAAFGVSGAFGIALVARRVNLAMLKETFLATAMTTAMVMFILVGAFLLQFVVSFLGIPKAITQSVVGMNLTAMEVVLLICVLYIILGMFMESLSMVVITIPVIIPVLQTLGVDLVWFGIIVVVLVEFALVTPPVGLNLFILQGLARQNPQIGGTSSDVIIGVLPFLFAMLVLLGLLLVFPDIAMWLVKQGAAS